MILFKRPHQKAYDPRATIITTSSTSLLLMMAWVQFDIKISAIIKSWASQHISRQFTDTDPNTTKTSNGRGQDIVHGPLARYVKLRVAHTPGTFSLTPLVSDPDMHHGTCVTHVPWCMLGSLTSGFLWSRWRRKCPRHSRHMRNSQFNLSGKRPL